MRSVEVTLPARTSTPSVTAGKNASSSMVENDGSGGDDSLSRAPGVACPEGARPGRYGRNVIAGSVSSGTSSLRSSSYEERLRLAPRSAISSSASLKSTPKTFSAQPSVA